MPNWLDTEPTRCQSYHWVPDAQPTRCQSYHWVPDAKLTRCQSYHWVPDTKPPRRQYYLRVPDAKPTRCQSYLWVPDAEPTRCQSYHYHQHQLISKKYIAECPRVKKPLSRGFTFFIVVVVGIAPSLSCIKCLWLHSERPLVSALSKFLGFFWPWLAKKVTHKKVKSFLFWKSIIIAGNYPTEK
jgi:hypothetical protein